MNTQSDYNTVKGCTIGEKELGPPESWGVLPAPIYCWVSGFVLAVCTGFAMRHAEVLGEPKIKYPMEEKKKKIFWGVEKMCYL